MEDLFLIWSSFSKLSSRITSKKYRMDSWIIPLEIIIGLAYVTLLIYTIIKILLDTDSTPKTLAYILMVITIPLIGIIIYFSFGINYRHKMLSKKGWQAKKIIGKEYNALVEDDLESILKSNKSHFQQYDELARFIHQIGGDHIGKNEVELLINGEEKFPEVLKMLKTAKNFIHMEYYDWENDVRGNQIKEILLDKVKEGVKVRVMYDDYASKGIKRNIVKELKKGGAEIYPVIKVNIVAFANRMNHRDHRKVIIIDGHVGFVGGINISDRYDNSIDTGLYWRDTHVKITGTTTLSLLRHWLVNWNICQPDFLSFDKNLVPDLDEIISSANSRPVLTQMIAGGPVYRMSNIMLTYFRIFTLARKKLYITNPYFIPSESIMDALKQAAVSGVDVRLMVPKKSDSGIVGASSKFYYHDLLYAGVKIFEYKKGFVHAKTVVADDCISVVGTANMDIRSFDLNFEIFSVTYNAEFANKLEEVYLNDLKECDQILLEEWDKQGDLQNLKYALARLSSSFL